MSTTTSLETTLRTIFGASSRLSSDEVEALVRYSLSEFERRLGVFLLPKLQDEADVSAWTTLLENEDSSADDWVRFWLDKLPQLREDINRLSDEFIARIRSLADRSS